MSVRRVDDGEDVVLEFHSHETGRRMAAPILGPEVGVSFGQFL